MGLLSRSTRANLRFAFNSLRFGVCGGSYKKYYFFEPYNRGVLNPISQKTIRSPRLFGDTFFVPFSYFVNPSIPDVSLFVIPAHVATLYLYVEHGKREQFQREGSLTAACGEEAFGKYKHPKALFEAAIREFQQREEAIGTSNELTTVATQKSPSLGDIIRDQGWVLAPRTYGGDIFVDLEKKSSSPATCITADHSEVTAAFSFGSRADLNGASCGVSATSSSSCLASFFVPFQGHSASRRGKDDGELKSLDADYFSDASVLESNTFFSHYGIMLDGGTSADVPLMASFIDFLNTSVYAPAPFRVRNRILYRMEQQQQQQQQYCNHSSSVDVREKSGESEHSMPSPCSLQGKEDNRGGGEAKEEDRKRKRTNRHISHSSLIGPLSGLVGGRIQEQLIREWLPPPLPPTSPKLSSSLSSSEERTQSTPKVKMECMKAIEDFTRSCDLGLELSLVCCTHAHPDHIGGANRYAQRFPQRAEKPRDYSVSGSPTDGKRQQQNQQRKLQKNWLAGLFGRKATLSVLGSRRRGVPVLVHPKATDWYRGGVGGFFQWVLDLVLAVVVSLTANPRGPLFNPYFTVPPSAAGSGLGIHSLVASRPSSPSSVDSVRESVLKKQEKSSLGGFSPSESGGLSVSDVRFHDLANSLSKKETTVVMNHSGERVVHALLDEEGGEISEENNIDDGRKTLSSLGNAPYDGARRDNNGDHMWQIIHASGHTDHMYMLYFPKGRLLYVSDMIILNSGYLKELRRRSHATFHDGGKSKPSSSFPSVQKSVIGEEERSGDESGALEEANFKGPEGRRNTKRRRSSGSGGGKAGGGLLRGIFYFFADKGSKGASVTSDAKLISNPATSSFPSSREEKSNAEDDLTTETCASSSQQQQWSWWTPFFAKNPFKVSAPVPIDIPSFYHASLEGLKDLDVATLAFPHGEVVPVELLASSPSYSSYSTNRVSLSLPRHPSDSIHPSAATTDLLLSTDEDGVAAAAFAARQRQRSAWLEVLSECEDKAKVPMFARTWLCSYNTVLKEYETEGKVIK